METTEWAPIDTMMELDLKVGKPYIIDCACANGTRHSHRTSDGEAIKFREWVGNAGEAGPLALFSGVDRKNIRYKLVVSVEDIRDGVILVIAK